MAATTRRTRPTKANLEAIADGSVARKNEGIENTPAPKSVRPAGRRRTVAAKPATATAPAVEAAPAVEVTRIRHTQEYTVDLFADGVEPERDYDKLLAKDPSEVNLDFVAWVKKYVGYDADPKTVQILISTYKEFQQSPEQKAKTIAKRQAAAAKRAAAQMKKAAAAKADAK